MVSRFEATILFYIFFAAAVVYLLTVVWNFLTNPIVLLVLGTVAVVIFGTAAYRVWSNSSVAPREYLAELDTVERYGILTKTGAVIAGIFFLPALLLSSLNILLLEFVGIVLLLLGMELEHRASGGEKWRFSD